jgi:hypothetical protein
MRVVPMTRVSGVRLAQVDTLTNTESCRDKKLSRSSFQSRSVVANESIRAGVGVMGPVT